MKKAVVFLAEGFEEIEALTPVDVLRRADVDVQIVSVGNSIDVIGSHDICVKADNLFSDVNFAEIDALILPGGLPGAHNLNAHEGLKKLIVEFSDQKKLIAAICAAPLVFGELNLLNNRKAICYPGFEKHLKGAIILDEACVVDDHIITGKGVGVSFEFSLAIVRALISEQLADELATKMLCKA